MLNNVDLLLYECGDGGDLLFQNGDLAVSAPLYQQVYLARFGGNVDASTDDPVQKNDFRKDYWANALFRPNSPNAQFNSRTERIINTTAIDSAGRNRIKRTAEADIAYLKDIAEIVTQVSIEGPDKIRIEDNINEKQGVVSIAWDVARGESIEKRMISRGNTQYIVDPDGMYIVDPDGNKILIP